MEKKLTHARPSYMATVVFYFKSAKQGACVSIIIIVIANEFGLAPEFPIIK
jgi:hypothetical protein